SPARGSVWRFGTDSDSSRHPGSGLWPGRKCGASRTVDSLSSGPQGWTRRRLDGDGPHSLSTCFMSSTLEMSSLSAFLFLVFFSASTLPLRGQDRGSAVDALLNRIVQHPAGISSELAHAWPDHRDVYSGDA